jgi:cytochrome c-type biogenesis protein CcmH/NrfG
VDWEKARYLVEGQVTYWRAVGKPEWADALEQCLAKAERCQTMQDVVLDLRQRLAQAEGGGERL